MDVARSREGRRDVTDAFRRDFQARHRTDPEARHLANAPDSHCTSARECLAERRDRGRRGWLWLVRSVRSRLSARIRRNPCALAAQTSRENACGGNSHAFAPTGALEIRRPYEHRIAWISRTK